MWHHNDLTNAAYAPGAASNPEGYTWNVDGAQHVVYRGTNGHINELWYNGAWHHSDLTNTAHAPGATGDPDGYTYTRDGDGTQHVIYRGADGHINELWYNGAWHHSDLTNVAHAPGAASNPEGYTWNVDGAQHVVYRGTDGHINELWYDGAWHHSDLTNVAHAPGATGDPDGYTYTRNGDGTQHVVYRGTDAHIHELWYSPTSNIANHSELLATVDVVGTNVTDLSAADLALA